MRSGRKVPRGRNSGMRLLNNQSSQESETLYLMYSHNLLAVFKNFKTMQNIDFHSCGWLDNKLPMHIFLNYYKHFKNLLRIQTLNTFLTGVKLNRGGIPWLHMNHILQIFSSEPPHSCLFSLFKWSNMGNVF